MKPFNCSPPALCVCFFLLLTTSIHWFAQFCCEANNAPPHNVSFIPVLVDRNLNMSQPLSHQRWNKLHSQWCPCFCFSIFPVLNTQDIHAIFKLWGRPFCSSLLVSFFLSVLLWKEFNPHSFVVTFHFSPSFGSPPVFYPASDDCRIHVNISYSACIYSTPLAVSLNDKSQLAHWKQQFGLVCLVLWHINLCRLFNAKSIFM